MRTLLVWLAALATTASVAAAQVPANTAIAVASFIPVNGIAYFDRTAGASTQIGSTPLPFVPWGGSCDSIENSPDNQSLVVTDGSGVFSVNKVTGAAVATSLQGNGNLAVWGCFGERDDFFTFHLNGQIWRHTNNFATASLFAAPGGAINAGCWDGTTGGVCALEYGTGRGLMFLDAAGNVTMTAGGGGVIPEGSGCDWNPHDGSILVSSFGQSSGNLFRVDRSGNVMTLGPVGSQMFETNNSVRVNERGPHEYLCGEFGPAPTHLTVTDPNGIVTTLNFSQLSTYGPSDAIYMHARPLWPRGLWASGQTGALHVNFPAHPNEGYALGMSFSHRGPALKGVGTLHLNVADPLFGLSQQGLGIFLNFAGTLDAAGSASGVAVRIPPGLGGLGIRVFVAGVTYVPSPFRITSVSNACGVTIL